MLIWRMTKKILIYIILKENRNLAHDNVSVRLKKWGSFEKSKMPCGMPAMMMKIWNSSFYPWVFLPRYYFSESLSYLSSFEIFGSLKISYLFLIFLRLAQNSLISKPDFFRLPRQLLKWVCYSRQVALWGLRPVLQRETWKEPRKRVE